MNNINQYATFKPEPQYEEKVWYNERGGYIIKSRYNPLTGKIEEKYLPNNQPSNFRDFLNNYFKKELR